MSDKRSFGFRKGRSCQDAMEQLFLWLAPGKCAEWVLEGDIKSCFDEISHDWLLEHAPMDKRNLNEFLKAGYVYNKALFPTEQGTPQGGIISPILANFTLNGIDSLMQDNFKRKWIRGEGHSIAITPKVNPVRYADDFVITARTKEIAEEAKELVRKHIAERGLKLSEEKTVITHISNGFDFLGFNFRKYNGKMLVKPSKKSQQKVKDKIRDAIKNNKNATQDNLIRMLNPIISGWSNYYRAVAAKETFGKIHNTIFLLLWKWARRRHPRKGQRWIKNRYWKTIGNNRWIFMDTETLLRMSDKKIIRHIPLKLDMNPYIDHEYFRKRHIRLLINRRF
jgi:RNA-directed DNA polymerase